MSARILLIDDDIDDRDIFREALYAVAPAIPCDCAANGKDVLLQLESKQQALPDLIFLDINLPVINGWQCLSLLKQTVTLQHIPVIIYSTSSYDRDKQMAKEMGALTFLSKPSDFEELKSILQVIADQLLQGTILNLPI